MAKAAKRTLTRGDAVVAKRGIVIGSAHAKRSSHGARFPESARKSAQASVRAALTKIARPTP